MGKAVAGPAVVYSFPSIIVPKNIAPQYLTELYPEGIYYGPDTFELQMWEPVHINATGIYRPLSRDDRLVIKSIVLSPAT
jgi:hypothetical protein